MGNENFSFPIGLDNRKALALFGCPVFFDHNLLILTVNKNVKSLSAVYFEFWAKSS